MAQIGSFHPVQLPATLNGDPGRGVDSDGKKILGMPVTDSGYVGFLRTCGEGGSSDHHLKYGAVVLSLEGIPIDKMKAEFGFWGACITGEPTRAALREGITVATQGCVPLKNNSDEEIRTGADLYIAHPDETMEMNGKKIRIGKCGAKHICQAKTAIVVTLDKILRLTEFAKVASTTAVGGVAVPAALTADDFAKRISQLSWRYIGCVVAGAVPGGWLSVALAR